MDDGDVFVIGDFGGGMPASEPGLTLKNSGLNIPRVGTDDGFLAKYDKDGTAKWLKGLYGNTAVNRHFSIEATSTNTAVISGILTSEITIGDSIITIPANTGNGGIWLAK